MDIIVAETAGFCFGVDRAVSSVRRLIEGSAGKIYTLGAVIHNPQVNDDFASRGVKIISGIEEAELPGNIVVRAHGIAKDVYEGLIREGVNVVDATCPYVKKIHNLVQEKYKEGYGIIIIGDKDHPEVKGINGWCENTAVILDSEEEVQALKESRQKVCVVAQTTITKEKWENINKCLENKFENIIKFDTICSATSQRQKEALQIAKIVDCMIVIGGRDSSNTQKLYEICKKYCFNTIKIEMPSELPLEDINKYKKVGITAGASTPDWIIKEVIGKMDELNRQENEMSFKEAFESSLVTVRSGEVVKGTVIGFNNTEVYVNLGFKCDGIIPIGEFSDDPDFNPEESIKIGDELEVFVVRVNDAEGSVMLSKKKVDALKSWDKIEEVYESKTPVKAKVVEVVNGGVIASANGIRIFIPASQISDKFVKDLREFLKQTVNVRIIEYNKQKRKIVGSQRVILEEEKAKLSSDLWESMETGKKYSGVVKSFTDFGAFVDIGGVDGLIHISELSWTKVKHPSEVLNIGDNIEVVILEFDRSKKRISLGYRRAEDNPWFNIEEKYKVGDVVKGKVARLVPFGAFIELEKGVDGLVHISQISSVRLAKPSDVLEAGQEIEAKVTEVNAEGNRISLSIKEVNPIDPVKEKDEAAAGGTGEDVPTEHKEDMNVTIADAAESSDEDKKDE
ncbi:4-hydroxy-3-methylbut-2-enyl diphosphate reductase [Anaerobacterium chartisolvens]|uniref:4-hydroxy-3-methylbut-2-enyl diphosphate reductase n=1 Tax=Anaerobacterium chartisolvens TaxID=1297424 RepID=A0A369BEI2_9FIRM|nr:bifunctional 4-hydroxy-3-methylbut-2-enyl diphosphate reductase/30S ribosomal protein S1 [Anaerobacterium chartisolvens]RCX19970.1 4-hydroxy-3-methylbut-2-enyl diphosphate reductase [Anaerobacterium chartisolvens]